MIPEINLLSKGTVSIPDKLSVQSNNTLSVVWRGKSYSLFKAIRGYFTPDKTRVIETIAMTVFFIAMNIIISTPISTLLMLCSIGGEVFLKNLSKHSFPDETLTKVWIHIKSPLQNSLSFMFTVAAILHLMEGSFLALTCDLFLTAVI